MVNDPECFLARPTTSVDNNSGLLEHSLKTAKKAQELTASLGLGDTAFYAGLLHDVGKLNPYYQILFSSGQINNAYIRAHAIFSALAVNKLLNIATLSKRSQKQALFAVAGHHSKLTQFTKNLEYINYDKTRFEKSHNGTYDNLKRFSEIVINREEFKDLAWDKCLRKFQNIPLSEVDFTADGDPVLDFLDFSSVYSALIQADRGSFFDWDLPTFGINLNTNVMVRKGSRLSDVRMGFQEYILSKNSFQDNLIILKAPTGIGKTKMFLDIVNKLSGVQCFERVFYFSPLLALTDDFEGKLFGVKKDSSVLNQNDAEKVLVYNHAFTGNLLKKRQLKDSGILFDVEAEDPEFFKTKEYFERESFNKQLIITTTQRLLMVLYSNTPADKEKLLSFKNSFLIIDEVQTIPKVLLPNIIALLKALTTKYNSKILLVSATIPDELQSLPILKTHEALEETYMQMTAKRIEYKASLDASEVALLGDNERTLFLFNTRRKALSFFEQMSMLKSDVLYLSSGIKKCDRSKIIQTKLQGREPVTVVSTQVLEAGVDVSFSRMYREMAPLDNVVQAMGRLSREGECSDPVLTVFRYDGDHKPYSELEVAESKELIPKIISSIDLYAKLPDYYKKVSAENLRNKNLAKDLTDRMRKLHFDGVWDFVRENAMPDQLGDSILVPTLHDYDEVRQQFLSSNSGKDRGKLYTRYAEVMAQLPSSVEKIDGLVELLDEELFDMAVYLPKKVFLDCVYDSNVGLDKWVEKD
ncbi:MAG: CRISPR-associated helicase Cas3' [Nitrososphaerota archaeon]|jgi:CRISPR-associated endonuclease/helicase Cas3|nr:CRISPR-associated helicase Cas3' [Nitrososphaerota archaeon]